MVAACDLQECGRERPLSIGHDYDIADVVAQQLIANGTAVPVADPDADEKSERPPEIKPVQPPEHKGRRR